LFSHIHYSIVHFQVKRINSILSFSITHVTVYWATNSLFWRHQFFWTETWIYQHQFETSATNVFQHLFICGKGSTRLCCVYSPILGGHPVTATEAKPFFPWEESKRVWEGERTLHHETTTQKRTWPRTKPSVAQVQSGVY
jgi:hypothetical protein